VSYTNSLYADGNHIIKNDVLQATH